MSIDTVLIVSALVAFADTVSPISSWIYAFLQYPPDAPRSFPLASSLPVALCEGTKFVSTRAFTESVLFSSEPRSTSPLASNKPPTVSCPATPSAFELGLYVNWSSPNKSS